MQTAPAALTFGGFDLTTIAIEFPKHLVQGQTSRLNVWSTVSAALPADGEPDDSDNRVFMQFQRMGQQAFKTVFVPASLREAFNASVTEDDTKNWS